jgi:hypothetical protein
MKNKLLMLLFATILLGLYSCNDDATDFVVTPPRDHSVQFPVEEKLIELFLSNNCPKITYTNGEVTKIEIIKLADANGLPTFKSYYYNQLDNSSDGYRYKSVAEELNESNPAVFNIGTYPRLIKKQFQHQGIPYSYWYFMVKPGAATKIPYGYTQATSARPTEYDGVLLDYKGYVINSSNQIETPFEETNYPTELRLTGVIRGFSRILPKFGSSSTAIINNDGSVTYQNYGSGVMIFPSGMGYYNNSSTSIPAYSPLLFTFNLYDVKRYDHDQDGIMSYREDYNNDGYFYANFKSDVNHSLNDDNDKDGATDALDYDDDGDGIITALEVINATTGSPYLDKDYFRLNTTQTEDLHKNCLEGLIPAYLNNGRKRRVTNVTIICN